MTGKNKFIVGHDFHLLKCLLILLFLTGCLKKQVDRFQEISPPPFGHDFYAAGVDIFSKENKVVETIGDPIKRIKETCEHVNHCVELYYPFGTIWLEGETEDNLLVSIITITASGVYGPRKTKVGDDIETVMRKFPYEDHPIQNKIRKLYGELFEDMTSGIAKYDDEGNIAEVVYYYGKGGFFTHRLMFKVSKGKVSWIEVGIQTI